MIDMLMFIVPAAFVAIFGAVLILAVCSGINREGKDGDHD